MEVLSFGCSGEPGTRWSAGWGVGLGLGSLLLHPLALALQRGSLGPQGSEGGRVLAPAPHPPSRPGAPGSSPPCCLWLTLASRRLSGSRRRGSSVSQVGWHFHRSWALGSVLSPEALSLVLGAGVGGCRPHRVCRPSLGGRGHRLTWDHPWNLFAGHARGLVGSVSSERLSRGGPPPRPASSASGPHTRAVPVEKLRPGAPPGGQPSCSHPFP